MEYDILIEVAKEDVHILNYVLEVEENVMNIRKYEDGMLRIIVPEDLKEEALKLLEGVKEIVDLKIVSIRKNEGSA
ncbi:MAG: DUF4911 domain-containing protein [Thermotogaceae bacterium]|nr:DUF4911 domain-containing protein [Thermotogaceae bacterium]RKX38927.1 MAG: DUF4911 domain-containing protein [Thermotogota bacterium]HDG62042.1 DUF4911 domain-containing protein [Thermotoga sp.]